MNDAFVCAEMLIGSWEAKLRAELPQTPIFDAHVHLGNDVDGMAGTYEELTTLCERYGIEHAQKQNGR